MDNQKINDQLTAWESQVVEKTLDKMPERASVGSQRLYTPLDASYDAEAFPGVYPMTRGAQPTRYRSRFWTMRSYSGFGTAEETNERYRFLLNQGVTGLSVAFDLPTQIGYDSDDEKCIGEVGKVGVAIDSLEDMEALFEGIPLDQVSTSMTINAPSSVLLAMYEAVAEKQGVTSEKLKGTIQNDVLKEYIARGTYIFPPQPSMRLTSDVFAYCKDHIPKWNTISLGAYHIREAGATAVQEIAFSFSNAIAYIEAALAAGLDIDDFAGRISWIFSADINFIEEAAKYRAARRLWAKILKERFGAKKNASYKLRVHTHTSGSILTAQQPQNNIVRVTLQALGAILGGTNSMASCAYDEALALPTEESATLALRTQQILAYESGVADVIDPLAGSYYVEAMTNQIEAEAEALIAQIESMGGAVKLIETGWIQSEILDSAYADQNAVEDGDRVIVGINKFVNEDEPDVNIQSVDPTVRDKQMVKIEALKAKRDATAVDEALKDVTAAAASDENLYPYILKAVKAYATLGEICDAMKVVFGEYEAATL
jgi:methylmalonyl-CoA mutase N-terminal domain/subunit